MDIHAWLAATALSACSEEPETSHFQQPDSFLLTKQAKSQSRRRNGEVSGSRASKLQAQGQTRWLQTTNEPRKACYGSQSISSPSLSASSSSNASTRSAASSVCFERRPRHKTRENLYNPNSGARRQRKRKKKSKDKKSQYHRTVKKTKKAGRCAKAGLKLAGDFHPTNVRGTRLTLNQPTVLGLFNKGRASSPKHGHGCENVPDLAFSEMRFLQNLKPAQDGKPASKHKSRPRINKAQITKEEIASYFDRIKQYLDIQDNPPRSTQPQCSPPKDASFLEGHAYGNRQPPSCRASIEQHLVTCPLEVPLETVGHRYDDKAPLNQIDEKSYISNEHLELHKSWPEILEMSTERSMPALVDQEIWTSPPIETQQRMHYPLHSSEGGNKHSFRQKKNTHSPSVNPYLSSKVHGLENAERAEYPSIAQNIHDFPMVENHFIPLEARRQGSAGNGELERIDLCSRAISPSVSSKPVEFIFPNSNAFSLKPPHNRYQDSVTHAQFINDFGRGRQRTEQYQDHGSNLDDFVTNIHRQKNGSPFPIFENEGLAYNNGDQVTFRDRNTPYAHPFRSDPQESAYYFDLHDNVDQVPRGLWRPNRGY